MTHILVLATGGTISSRKREDGAAVATDSADAVLQAAGVAGPVSVEAIDVMRVNSFNLTLGDLRRIAEGIRDQLARPDVDGIVITHGTDTLEETAMLVDLVHADDRPVVFTGAQLSSDSEGSDGPRNLRDAVAVAAAATSRGKGALISFGGEIFAARGTRKSNTTAAQPFTAQNSGPIGHVLNGTVSYSAESRRPKPLAFPTEAFDRTRVDILTMYPGAPADSLRAALSSGAAGVVIAGTGTGNLNREVVEAVREATEAGAVIALSTRVSGGPVSPIYGDGGAVDAVRAGAVPVTWLPFTQARILLALLLSQHEPSDVATVLRNH